MSVFIAAAVAPPPADSLPFPILQIREFTTHFTLLISKQQAQSFEYTKNFCHDFIELF